MTEQAADGDAQRRERAKNSLEGAAATAERPGELGALLNQRE